MIHTHTSHQPSMHTSLHQSPNSSIARKQKGFTLIEVMVALAILSIVAVAASRVSISYLHSISILETKTLAQFVAQNLAIDLKINEQWITGEKTETVSQQGKDWQVTYTPNATASTQVQIVDIHVVELLNSNQDEQQETNNTGSGSHLSIVLTNKQS